MQILKDWHLAMYVAVLAIIDIILLTIVTAIPEARSVGKLVVDQEHPPFRDVRIIIIITLHSLLSLSSPYGLLHGGVTGPGGGGVHVGYYLHPCNPYTKAQRHISYMQ